MGVREWMAAPVRRPTGRRRPEITTLIASGRRVDTQDQRETDMLRRTRQPWQDEALDYYREIGEVRFAYNFASDIAGRCRFYVATRPVSADPPVPADDPASGVSAAAAAQAQANVDALQPMPGGGFWRRAALNLGVVGEAWVVGWPGEAADDWQVHSIRELTQVSGGGGFELRRAPGVTPEPVPRDAAIVRLWQPDLEHYELPTSSLHSVLGSCETLLIFDRMLRAQGKSRLNAGFLLVPSELADSLPGDARAKRDAFLADLMDVAITPINDEGSASAVAPGLISGPADKLKELRHLTFDRQIDAVAADEREKLVRRIAQGLPTPVEIVTGLADLNHWTAWQVDEAGVKQAEPLLEELCASITRGYLWDSLDAAGVPASEARRMFVWYDPTDAIANPDETELAKDAHDRIVISDEAYRRRRRIPETDAPDAEEVLRRTGVKRGIMDGPITEALLRLTLPSLTVDRPSPDDAPAGGGGDAPAGSDEGEGEPAVPDTAPPGVTAAAVTAAAPTGEPDGVMVAFYPPADIAAALAVPDGLPAGEIHLTLAYLGDAADLADPDALRAAVEGFAAAYAPVDGEVSGVGRFSGSDPELGDAVYASVDALDLPTWREALVAALADAGYEPASNHGFTPHMTLTYVPPGEPSPVERLDPLPLTFGEVVVCVGPDRDAYPLGGTLVAAAASRDVGPTLADMDQRLRERLGGLADAALARALERAGSRLRAKAARTGVAGTRTQREAALAASLGGVPATHVVARLGRAAVTAAATTDDELLEGAFAELEEQFGFLVAGTQAAVLDLVPELAPAERAQVETAQEQERSEAWAWLSGALVALARARLYDPSPDAPAEGEFDATATVPPGLVREALSRAGGGAGAAASPDDPPAGVATGPRLRTVFAEHGAPTRAWRWRYGGMPRTQAFRPHLALAGREFRSFRDPVLANPGSWPPVAYLHPGDHLWCGCDFEPVVLLPAS